MRDPERLRQSRTTDPEVRELLQSLRDIKPESSTGSRSWGAMAVKLAALPSIVPPPGGAVASGGAAATSSGGSLAMNGVGAAWFHAVGVKLVVAALVPVVLGGGAYWVHARRTRAEPANAAMIASPPVATPAFAPAANGFVASDGVEDAPAPKPTTRAPAAAGSATRVSRLEAEASMVANVRSELRQGNASEALVALNQLRARFPNGVLGQERDVLAIEVSAANGDTVAAKRKASAFIAAHPSSPYNAKVKRFVEAP